MQIRIRPKPRNAPDSVRVGPVTVRIPTRPLRILDLDLEARPLHWIANDYVSKEITAIAWAWTDRPEDVTCVLLGEQTLDEMVAACVAAIQQADMVTGHFIRGYDLPTLNGALTELGRPALGDLLAHDTKLDLVRRSGLSSSQENLGAMLGLSHPKVSMNQATWREANRLTKKGRALVRQRVVGDVQQHIELRHRLLQLGYLGGPKVWKSNSQEPLVTYVP